jgi:transposase
MASVVHCKNPNGVTYLYESTGYRDKENGGKVKNKRTSIGLIDKNGKTVYKPEYIERMRLEGTPVAVPENQLVFSISDVKNSAVKEVGLMSLLENIASRTGLSESLKSSLGKNADKILVLAAHLVANGDPFMHCEEWLAGIEISSDVGSMSSQRISELMQEITDTDRDRFYANWSERRTEQEYLALDITSTSSYSELIGDVEWGYNRDKEDLPQVNLCMLMGETSGLPVYQTTYSGSLSDVSTLEATLDKFAAITDDKPILTVMDKGFYKKKHVTKMLEMKHKFIIAVPFSSAVARGRVGLHKMSIDALSNTVLCGGDTLRAVTDTYSWDKGYSVFLHTFMNPSKSTADRQKFFRLALELKAEAETNFDKYFANKKYTRFLKFNDDRTIEINETAVNDAFENSGWLVIVTNDIADKDEAIRIYRAKDVVEKGFNRLKNSLDLGRLRVHGDRAMQNKIFVGFVALILMSYIHQVMLKADLYKKYTLRELLRELSKIRCTSIGNQKVQNPTTKNQREILAHFGMLV